MLLLAYGALAEPPATAPSQASAPTITRSFDVRSLLTGMPSYPLEASMIPGADEAPSGNNARDASPPGAQASVDSLIKLVVDSVAPNTWRDSGGSIGSIREYQGRLVVTQTAENMNSVQQVLDSLSSVSPANVRMNAEWVWLKPEQLQSLRDRFHGPGDATMIVDEKTLGQLELYSRGQTTGFDGQTVHIASIALHHYVSDATPVVATGVGAYAPTISTVKSGVALQITPHLLPEGLVRLDLFNVVADVRGIADTDIALPLGATTLPAESSIVERPTVQTAQLRTTVRIPLGKNVVIGGMPINHGTGPAAQGQLYLIVDVEASK
jgi:hypothetical protein